MDWTVAAITMSCKDGDVQVPAWTCGIWALDFRVFEPFPGELMEGWALTHVPTGYLGGGITAPLSRAMEIVAEVAAIGDWCFTDIKCANRFTKHIRALRDRLPDEFLLKSAVFSPTFEYEREAHPE